MILPVPFRLDAGLSLLTRSFEATPAEESLILPGGIRYQSRWLPGVTVRSSLFPFASTDTLHIGGEVSYSYHKLEALRAPPRLFEDTGAQQFQSLAGEDQRIRYRLKLIIPFATGARQHAFTIGGGGLWLSHQIAENDLYIGPSLSAFSLGTGLYLSAIPGLFSVQSQIAFVPVALFHEGADEVGEAPTSRGALFDFSLKYNLSTSIFLQMGGAFLYLKQTPIGAGRGGRVVQDAEERSLRFELTLGYLKF
ncbi:MAG: hypothetical protein VYD19_06980 [Myxococcota bacterium]|nr:hypothetical protein [Myxococcota bacterium]